MVKWAVQYVNAWNSYMQITGQYFHFHAWKFHFHAWKLHAMIFSCIKLFVRVTTSPRLDKQGMRVPTLSLVQAGDSRRNIYIIQRGLLMIATNLEWQSRTFAIY